jgi:hypothetical protein
LDCGVFASRKVDIYPELVVRTIKRNKFFLVLKILLDGVINHFTQGHPRGISKGGEKGIKPDPWSNVDTLSVRGFIFHGRIVFATRFENS